MTTFAPSPRAARHVLQARGPLTPDKVRAAEFYDQMRRVEPWWPLWLLADVTAALALLLAPRGSALATVALYAATYAISLFWRSGRPEAAELIARSDPDRAAAAAAAHLPSVRAVAQATGIVFMAAAGLLCLLPEPAMRAVGGVFAVFIAFHVWNRVSSHVIARRVLAKAPRQEWWPAYVADRELREAAAEVLLHPGT